MTTKQSMAGVALLVGTVGLALAFFLDWMPRVFQWSGLVFWVAVTAGVWKEWAKGLKGGTDGGTGRGTEQPTIH